MKVIFLWYVWCITSHIPCNIGHFSSYLQSEVWETAWFLRGASSERETSVRNGNDFKDWIVYKLCWFLMDITTSHWFLYLYCIKETPSSSKPVCCYYLQVYFLYILWNVNRKKDKAPLNIIKIIYFVFYIFWTHTSFVDLILNCYSVKISQYFQMGMVFGYDMWFSGRLILKTNWIWTYNFGLVFAYAYVLWGKNSIQLWNYMRMSKQWQKINYFFINVV